MDRGPYGGGAPELIAEICLASTEVDFGPKAALYKAAGVREYITIEMFRQRIVWRMLEGGAYITQGVPADGVLNCLRRWSKKLKPPGARSCARSVMN